MDLDELKNKNFYETPDFFTDHYGKDDPRWSVQIPVGAAIDLLNDLAKDCEENDPEHGEAGAYYYRSAIVFLKSLAHELWKKGMNNEGVKL